MLMRSNKPLPTCTTQQHLKAPRCICDNSDMTTLHWILLSPGCDSSGYYTVQPPSAKRRSACAKNTLDHRTNLRKRSIPKRCNGSQTHTNARACAAHTLWALARNVLGSHGGAAMLSSQQATAPKQQSYTRKRLSALRVLRLYALFHDIQEGSTDTSILCKPKACNHFGIKGMENSEVALHEKMLS